MIQSNQTEIGILNDKQQKYARFKQWFVTNGGYSKSINFPTLFEPGNYIGLSAQKQIPSNQVILAVPKHLTIGASTAINSQLKHIIEEYQILRNPQDDDTDYNVICLFLIMEKMKGSKSFYHPYLELLDSSETVMNWQDEEILKVNDPYFNLQFINGIRKQFQPIYRAFQEIAQKYPSIFPQPLTKQLFDQFYAVVMTRGFGWGLPQTMLVPFGDFLNHSSSGVNHYVFDSELESTDSKQYIKKKFQLDLSIFPFLQNQSLLPIDYQMNSRQKYIYNNKQKLQNLGINYDFKLIKLDPNITNPVHNTLIEEVIDNDFNEQIYLSSDSEDNDSDGEGQGLSEDDSEEQQSEKQISQKNNLPANQNTIPTNQIQSIQYNSFQNGENLTKVKLQQSIKTTEQTKNSNKNKIKNKQQTQIKIEAKKSAIFIERKYLRYVYSLVQKQLDQRYTQPKPNVNAEFQDGVKFDWWWNPNQKTLHCLQKKENINSQAQQDHQFNISNSSYAKTQKESKYFIVASSKRIYPNEQIYNCYGRRSNRFLLIWYGFCFFNNKYDSVPFRIWAEQVQKRTGNLVWSKYITQKQYLNGVPIGNERFNVAMLSDEFRLKKKAINYKLLAFIRYKYLRGHIAYREYYKKNEFHVNKIVSIHMQIEIFLTYQRYLNELSCLFNLEYSNKGISNVENKQIQNPGRKYFQTLLQESNWDIIKRNVIAVKQVIKVLLKIQDLLEKHPEHLIHVNEQPKYNKIKIKFGLIQKQILQSLYKNLFIQSLSQPNLIHSLIQYNSKQRLGRQLKIMVRQYFRLLSSSIVCLTLQPQFN